MTSKRAEKSLQLSCDRVVEAINVSVDDRCCLKDLTIQTRWTVFNEGVVINVVVSAIDDGIFLCLPCIYNRLIKISSSVVSSITLDSSTWLSSVLISILLLAWSTPADTKLSKTASTCFSMFSIGFSESLSLRVCVFEFLVVARSESTSDEMGIVGRTGGV